ncbi:MAG: hypothetical protein ACLQDV_25155, partial [Candidatus Binataceae bacterium]
ALQGTNESTVSVFDPSAFPLIHQPCFWPDAPRPSSRNPAQNFIRQDSLADLTAYSIPGSGDRAAKRRSQLKAGFDFRDRTKF